MPREVLRLVAVVALLAFLAANSSAHPHAPPSLGHCACDGDHPATAPLHRDDADGPAGPHHGEDRPEPSCPCPGGCAFCCVAKVPSTPPAVAPAIVTPCVVARIDEIVPAYDSPFSGTPTRPPRF